MLFFNTRKDNKILFYIFHFLFKKYRKYALLSLTNQIADIQNDQLENNDNDKLIDLGNAINNKEIAENQNPIVDDVEKILDLNKVKDVLQTQLVQLRSLTYVTKNVNS